MGFRIENTVLIRYTEEPDITEVIIPDGITSIGAQAFWWCRNITDITIPESVKTISLKAFKSCFSLKSIRISNGLQYIHPSAFWDCNEIGEIIWCDKKIPVSMLVSRLLTSHMPDILNLIIHKDFSVQINPEDKHAVIWYMFCAQPEDRQILQYIRRNFINMFPILIEKGNAEILQKLLDKQIFVTRKNIDKLIQCAIDKQNYALQVMLTEYKHQKFGYQEIADRLKL